MELSLTGIKNKAIWESAGYTLPRYDVAAAAELAKSNPFWIHFGCGNLFRAFQAKAADELLNSGAIDRGIIAAEGFDGEIVKRALRPHDNLSVLVTLKADGTVEKSVVGSIAETLTPEDTERLNEIFACPSLQLATFTITEKGYSIYDENLNPHPDIAADFRSGPDNPSSYPGMVASLLYTRFKSGRLPIAMVSMDNCSHNGDKLKAAMLAFAKEWEKNGRAEKGFAEYIGDPKCAAFPWTMIDKITPRPDKKIQTMLEADGLIGMTPIVTKRNTYTAPFVNAEECQYLVIEDSFPGGRPNLEGRGIMFTDRDTVDKAERMKVCTCLNPLHTALAVFGCLLGYSLISDEMKNPMLKKLVEGIGYTEGLPASADPGIIEPKEFLKSVIEERLPNPFMPDSPQRIATDTSQKLAVRFGETIKEYMRSDTLKISDLRLIPLVLAAWIRYLTGIDDSGERFKPSPDPLLSKLKGYVSGICLGEAVNNDKLRPLLSDDEIFGVNLYDAGLAEKVIDYLNKMNASPGGVAETLKNALE